MKISELQNIANLLSQIPTESIALGTKIPIRDRLSYAVKKNLDKINKAWQKDATLFEEKNNDLGIELASTDAEGVLLPGVNGRYQYKPDNLVKLNKAISENTRNFLETELQTPEFYVLPNALKEKRVETLDLFLVEELEGILFEKGTTDDLMQAIQDKEQDLQALVDTEGQ